MLKERVFDVMSKVLGVSVESLGPDPNTNTVSGWDSLKHISLVFALEEEFGVQFPEDQLTSLTSAARIIEVLGELGVS